MAFILTGLAWLVAVPVVLALAIYALEIAAGLAPQRARRAPAGGTVPAAAILVPAHDEGASIGATVAGLRSVAGPDCRILVIADNCTDDTAARAAEAGAEVAVRSDLARRGKGFALDFGRAVLAADPPAVVIVVDADCRLAPGSVEALVAAAAAGAPAQAINLLAEDTTAPPMVQISSFAFLVKNLVRLRGMERLGGATTLTGTGMAMPWPVFATAPLASGDIAEDLGISIALIAAGHHPRTAPDAAVRSGGAAYDDSLQQRRRWEHGFIANARRHALPLIGRGLRSANRALVFVGLHLLVPPLALLMLVAVAALALAGGAAMLGAQPAPALAIAAALALALALTAVVWIAHGRSRLRPGALVMAPLYVLWKLPIYLGLLRGGEQRWVRTPRRPDDPVT